MYVYISLLLLVCGASFAHVANIPHSNFRLALLNPRYNDFLARACCEIDFSLIIQPVPPFVPDEQLSTALRREMLGRLHGSVCIDSVLSIRLPPHMASSAQAYFSNTEHEEIVGRATRLLRECSTSIHTAFGMRWQTQCVTGVDNHECGSGMLIHEGMSAFSDPYNAFMTIPTCMAAVSELYPNAQFANTSVLKKTVTVFHAAGCLVQEGMPVVHLIMSQGWFHDSLVATTLSLKNETLFPTLPSNTRLAVVQSMTLFVPKNDNVPPSHEFIPQRTEETLRFATLVYSDGYAKGVETLAASLAAAYSNQRVKLHVLVGCKYRGTHSLPSRSELQAVLLSAHAEELCDPMLSKGTLTALRTLQQRVNKLATQDSVRSYINSFLNTSHSNHSGAIDAFRRFIVDIRLVPNLPFEAGVQVIGLDNGVWMKAHAWALTPQEAQDSTCVVLLDADAIVMKTFPKLHDASMCHDYTQQAGNVAGVSFSDNDLKQRVINVGLLIIHPHIPTWFDMLRALDIHQRYQVVETTFFNWYFMQRKHALPPDLLCLAEDVEAYAALKGVRAPFLDGVSSCFVLDFSHCGPKRYKPWLADDPPTDPALVCRRQPSHMYRQSIQLWRDIYAAVQR